MPLTRDVKIFFKPKQTMELYYMIQ